MPSRFGYLIRGNQLNWICGYKMKKKSTHHHKSWIVNGMSIRVCFFFSLSLAISLLRYNSRHFKYCVCLLIIVLTYSLVSEYRAWTRWPSPLLTQHYFDTLSVQTFCSTKNLYKSTEWKTIYQQFILKRIRGNNLPQTDPIIKLITANLLSLLNFFFSYYQLSPITRWVSITTSIKIHWYLFGCFYFVIWSILLLVFFFFWIKLAKICIRLL